MKRVTLLTSAFFLGSFALAQAALLTFDTVETNPPTAAGPGVWEVDRAAPSSFQSATLSGENVLEVQISGADYTDPYPTFTNTQGYKLDLDPLVPEGANFISADLYINPDWFSGPGALTEEFRVGLWATAVDATDVISGYPIVSFGTEGFVGEAGFRYYSSDLADWVTIGTLTDVGASVGDWVTLSMENLGTSTEYNVNGFTATDAFNYGTNSFDNVIIQAKNHGEDYTVYWDNLYAVPEPSTFTILGLMGATLIGGFFFRRRRLAEQAAELEAQA